MYRHPRTLSTLLGLSSWTKRPCKHLLTAIFVIMMLAEKLRCNPIPCTDAIRDQPFAQYIRNSCEGRENDGLSEIGEKEKVSLRTYILNQTLPSMVSISRNDTEVLLKENVDSVCRNDTYSYLSNSITMDSLQGKEEKEALLDIYSSLLTHMASVRYAREQDIKYSDPNCASNRPNHSMFQSRTKRLGAGLTEIACELQTALLTFSMEESVLTGRSNNVLDTLVCDNALCSRRILNDCRTIKSTFALLDTFGSYLQQIQQ